MKFARPSEAEMPLETSGTRHVRPSGGFTGPGTLVACWRSPQLHEFAQLFVVSSVFPPSGAHNEVGKWFGGHRFHLMVSCLTIGLRVVLDTLRSSDLVLLGEGPQTQGSVRQIESDSDSLVPDLFFQGFT